MTQGQHLCRRMVWGAVCLGTYGVVQAVARLPDGLPASSWLATIVWAVGFFTGAGAVLAGIISGLSLAVARVSPRSRRATVAAGVETTLVGVLFFWLLLNEFLYLTTSEVVGLGALMLLWYDMGPVLENAWEMGARYLLTTIFATLAVIAAVFVLSRRGHRGLWPGVGRSASAEMPVQGSTRLAGALTAALTILALLVGWQFAVAPSQALTVLCRTSPSLRALDLTRRLAGFELMGPPPAAFGPPVISDAQYQAGIVSPASPPNVIYILMESTSAKALHCYGYPKPDITPNIDALAAEGALFEHCLAGASFSSCGLTSAATSLYMLRGERFDYFADTTFPFMSFQRALKLGGWQLTLFSSGNESFDNINRFCPPADFEEYFSHDTCDIAKNDCMRMDDQYAVGRFEEWMAGRRDPRPFYAGFYLQSPHFNYEVPEPWYSHYQPIPPLFSNGDGVLHIPADVLPKLKNQYDNAMRYADYWVGRIVASLKQAGQLDRTLIVITGDHGEAFMEHGLARHATHTWEEMIHIPLIVWMGPALRDNWPHLAGTRIADTVSGVDIAPTIAALTGLPPYPGWQGVNVADPGYTDRDRAVFSMTQYTRWQEVAVFNRLKYICDLTDVTELLFDLKADPGEMHDLATEQPELLAVMRGLVSGWHTHQLSYYQKSEHPFTHYVGCYQPGAQLCAKINALADPMRVADRADR